MDNIVISILVAISVFAHIEGKNWLLPQEDEAEILFKTIAENGYQKIIYHLDDSTKHKFVGVGNTESFIINYDRFGINSEIVRPAGHSYLNLVLLNDTKKFQFFTQTKPNLLNVDTVIFAVENIEKVGDVLLLNSLKNVGSVIVYERANKVFYSLDFYPGIGGDKNGTVQLIKNNTDFNQYFNNFSNFNGCKFRVGFAEYIPFVYCSKHSNKEASQYNCTLSGAESNILKEMSRRLNFSFELHLYADSPDGNWIHMVKEANKTNIDFAIGGITASYDRFQFADFTSYIFMEVFEALYAISDRDNNIKWNYVIQPFHVKTWFFVLVFFLLLSVSLWIFYASIENIKPDRSYVFMVSIRVFTEQPLALLQNRKFLFRLIFTTIYLLSFNITYTYKTKLTSNTITRKFVYPSTLGKLLDHGYTFQVNRDDWSVLYHNLKTSKYPAHREILKKFNKDLDYCDILQRVLQNPVAFIEEKYYLTTQMLPNCSDYFDANDVNYLRITTERLFPSNHAWAMQKYAPYRDRFSQFIGSLFENGVLQWWYKILPKHPIKKANEIINGNRARAMDLKRFLECVIILMLGYLVAALLFFIELFYPRYKGKL